MGTVEIVDCTGDDGDIEWHLANPVRLAEPIPPIEHPQPVWFHPFGRPDDVPAMTLAEASLSSDDSSDEPSDVPGSTANTRFSVVLAATPTAFTPFHAKYFAHELSPSSVATTVLG